MGLERSARAIGAAAVVVLATAPCASLAGGFYVPQKGAVGVGLATAGDAARASDPSTVFFNPAGMTQLPGRMGAAGVDLLSPNVRISNSGSTATSPGTLGASAAYAGDGGNAGQLTPVPNLYYVQPVGNGDFWAGLAITGPFGLGLDYGQGWWGRYDSIESNLVTIDIAPSVAYRITPAWSIGAGLNVQYADAELSNALPNTLVPGGPTAATDGLATLTGDSWAVGFNVGVLFVPQPATRVGVHYRSRITHNLDGQLKVESLTGPLAAGNGVFGTSGKLRLPAIASLAINHELSARWRIGAELQWFGWNVFDEVRVKFDNGASDAVRPQNFRNSVSLAVGGEFRANARWTLRGGVRVENTPTVNTYRNTSIPDSDLLWLGLGATYHASDRLQVDAALLRATFKHADIDLTTTFYDGTPASGSVVTRGRTNNVVDTFSIAVRYAF